MPKAIYESLQMDLPALAQLLARKGRGKDTVLAHITPKEAELLKKRGGRGSTNPETGLLEFDDGLSDIGVSEAQQAAPLPTDQTALTQAQQYFEPTQSATTQTTTPTLGAGYSPAQTLDTGTLTPGAQQFQAGESYLGGLPGYSAQVPQFQTGITPAALPSPFDASLGPTSQAALQQAELQGPTPSTTTAEQRLKDQQKGGFLDALTQKLQTPENLLKLGLGLGGGALGLTQASRAQKQIADVTGQSQAIAQPYQQQGQQLVAAAQRGELSPANQQALQAAQAQIQQSIASRGGVGAQQAANQIANLTNNLLENQYQYGLNVMQIGDNVALGAIKDSVSLNMALNQINNQFYTSLAQVVGGTPFYLGGKSAVTPVTPYG